MLDFFYEKQIRENKDIIVVCVLVCSWLKLDICNFVCMTILNECYSQRSLAYMVK